jgi:hypothetical protein
MMKRDFDLLYFIPTNSDQFSTENMFVLRILPYTYDLCLNSGVHFAFFENENGHIKFFLKDLEQMHRSVVVSVDVGSSSVRCSGYEIQSDSNGTSNTISEPIASCSYLFCSVHPLSGKILIDNDDKNKNLFHIIDHVIDEVLTKILTFYESTNTLYKIDTFGFSTFVMNLIAVDTNCIPIGSEYTMSYACNSASVAAEVDSIKK